jgi:hypothetical protein
VLDLFHTRRIAQPQPHSAANREISGIADGSSCGRITFLDLREQMRGSHNDRNHTAYTSTRMENAFYQSNFAPMVQIDIARHRLKPIANPQHNINRQSQWRDSDDDIEQNAMHIFP